jgi:hypothetical protein
MKNDDLSIFNKIFLLFLDCLSLGEKKVNKKKNQKERQVI